MQQEGTLKANKINTSGLVAGEYVIALLKGNAIIERLVYDP